MSHFFFIEENDLPRIRALFKNRNNLEYAVLNRSNGFADIAQYTEKYQNVKIITVREDNLDVKRELR